MKGDRAWVSVSEVIPDSGAFFTKVIAQRPDDMQYYAEAMTKLNKLSSIKDRDMPVQVVAGEDKTIDVVVEIFNNVNSGGTKLSKGDLALAKICAQWPDMRAEMKAILARLGKKGFWFKQDWLLKVSHRASDEEKRISASSRAFPSPMLRTVLRKSRITSARVYRAHSIQARV